MVRKPGFESKKLCRAWAQNAHLVGAGAKPEDITMAMCSCGQIQTVVGPLTECQFPNPSKPHEILWSMSLAQYEVEIEAMPEDSARPRKDPGLNAAMQDAAGITVDQSMDSTFDADKVKLAMLRDISKAGKLRSEKLRPLAAAQILARIERDASTLAPSDILALAQAADIVSRL